MKLYFLITFLGFCSIHAAARIHSTRDKLDFDTVPLPAKQELRTIIAEKIAATFIKKLRQNDTSKAPVLPEFPESFPIENAELDLDELGMTDLISGHVALRDGEATGWNTILDDLAFAITIPARITYKLESGDLAVNGNYDAAALINYNYTIPINGAGKLNVTLSNLGLNLVVSATINLINGRIIVNSVAIDVGFDSVSAELENLVICDEIINWDEFNEDAKDVFDQFWAENKAEIEQLVKDILVEMLKECNVFDLIGGDYSCIIPAPSAPTTNAHIFVAAITYFRPIMPRLTCELAPTPDPSLSTTTTTTTTTGSPPEATTEDVSHQCSDMKPCPAGSFCEESAFGSFCVCNDQLYSVPTNQQETPCARINGASCILSDDDPEHVACVRNSVCLASNATHGRCECSTGFIGTERGICAADFGQNCGNEHEIECFEGFSLACRRGRCSCASPDLVFEAGRGCVAPAGEPCNVHTDVLFPHRVQCATELECVQIRVGRHVCQSTTFSNNDHQSE